MCAVDVPAFMIQAPPILLLSGRPVDCVVADPENAESREQLQAKYEQLHAA